ncbi:hypothetical protein BG005_002764 [Podila minutissima]|nr:hypothetical protein BG005_002764 [Podila minutissima]
MSSTSSCNSSPLSSTESGADIDLLDMPMFFPGEPSIYQQILDFDTPSKDFPMNQYQQPSLDQLTYIAQQQQSKQQFQYEIALGLGTPPMSPAGSFQKYNSLPTDIGTMFYNSPSQAFQSSTMIPQQQPYIVGQALVQQYDNLDSMFSPSSSSCSSHNGSLTNSPYAESPLTTTINTDFDLFPVNNNNNNNNNNGISNSNSNNAPTPGYPSAPIMAPQTMYHPQASPYQHLTTPPMNQMDLEREVSTLFKNEGIQACQYNGGSNSHATMTTEMSLLCKCPGQFPCGEQLPTDGAYETEHHEEEEHYHSTSGSPLQGIREEGFDSESDSEVDQEEQAISNQYESDTNYSPQTSRRKNSTGRVKRESSKPYSSAYSPDASSPVRQDRRRSSGSLSSYGSSHNSQYLMDPENLPAITDIHVCPVCQRRFTRPFNLRSHIMTHSTLRPFPCDQCHWKFTRQHDLLRHKKAKHPESMDVAVNKNKAYSAA